MTTIRQRVLAVGEDWMLLATRVALLNRQYEAVACGDKKQVMPLLRAEAFDLMLVCHSLPHEETMPLLRQVHEAFPHLCLVRLLKVSSPEVKKPIAHKLVTVSFEPEVWLKAVDDLLLQSRPE